MIRCLIVDDEKNAHYVIKNHIKTSGQMELVGQCYTVQTALEFLQTQRVDVIFLDIKMPGSDGFSLIPHLKKQQAVVLTTAFSEYALKSYDYAVVDYLLKPISYERFAKTLERLLEKGLSAEATECLSLKVDNVMKEFQLDEIYYIQSWGNYIKLHTVAGEFICNSTTVEALRKLPRDKFIRIHKSYVVAIDQIDHFNNEYAVLKSNEFLPIGITYRRVLETIQGINDV